MTTETQTFWTILPNGIVNGKARLSVFVTPKLIGEPGDTLKLIDFPDMLDWPQLAEAIEFKLFWRKDAASSTVAVDGGTQYVPINRGEFGLDTPVWNHLFKSSSIPVEPELRSADAAVAAQQTPLIGVTYRAGVIDRMVSETQVYHTMRSVLNVGEEPSDPRFTEKKRFDRMVYLASGEGETQLQTRKFATKIGEDGFKYDDASLIGSFFGEVPLDGPIEELAANDTALNSQFQAFALYHRHGIKNRNYKIRRPFPEPEKYPDLNFHDAAQYQVTAGQDRVLLEFSENMPVILPAAVGVPAGFEVNIFYAPDESIESVVSKQELVRRVPRNGTNDSGGFIYNPITIRASAGDTIASEGTSLQLGAFRGVKLTRTSDGIWANQTLEQQDFHAIISGLGSYPILMRRLGLLFDIEVDIAVLPGEKEQFQLLVEPVFSENADVDQRPDFSAHVGWSACETGAFKTETESGIKFCSFTTISEEADDGSTLGGFQVLNRQKLDGSVSVGFSLQDTDAAIHKVVDKAIADGAPPDPESLEKTLNPYTSERRILTPGSPGAATDGSEALEIEGTFRQPASRSTGISVFLDQDGTRSIEQFRRNVTSSRSLTTSIGSEHIFPPDYATAPVSFRDDVMVGWTVDVFVSGEDVPEADQTWYSLNDRQLKLNYLGNEALGQYLAPSDANWIEKAGASEFDENARHQLRISDYNFRFDQWSLSSRHPSMAAPELGDGDEAWQRSVSLNVDAETSAFSLPKLRYRRTYNFRATLKDLAGNGVHFDYANAGMATPKSSLAAAVVSEPIVYRRLAPISPPVFYALQPQGPGSKVPKLKDIEETESIQSRPVGPDQSDVLIIRSGDQVPEKLGAGEWLVLPPDTDFQEAEAAGMLDGFSDPDEGHFVLKNRYDKKLPDKYDPGFLASIRWPSGRLGTPYLPDGYAAGATFCYLPAAERKPLLGGFSNRANNVLASSRRVGFDLRPTIPDRKKPFSQPFRLRLRSGNRNNRLRGRNIEINLPPGEQQLVKVSCYPDEARLDHFELAHRAMSPDTDFLVQTEGKGLSKSLCNNFAAVKSTLSGGLVYQISPSKLVRLIHAVVKPVQKPVFSGALQVTNRVTGGNAVVMEDVALGIHRVSTGRIEVFVEWEDYQDIPGLQVFPSKRTERRPCFGCDVPLPDVTIAPDETHRKFDIGGRHGFPSNKHLSVRYQAVAVSRYKEYFDKAITDESANTKQRSELSCAIPILNTAPPPPPEAVYILPHFFRKERVDTDPMTTSTAREAGFTVFMKRGWFRSGQDERLGVVLQSAVDGAANTNPNLPPVPITEWGSDPTILDRNPIKEQPALNDFLNTVDLVTACPMPADFDPNDPPVPDPLVLKCDDPVEGCIVSVRDGVALPPLVPPVEVVEPQGLEQSENPQQEPEAKTRENDGYGPDLAPEQELRVDVATYAVECDFRKDLLYAEVRVKQPGAYAPFVRFALARYQKNSAKYCALSSIVHVDYVQLTPDRVVSVTRSGESPQAPRRVVVSGPGRGDDAKGHRTNILRVYRLNDRDVREQYPLEVIGEWVEQTEDTIELFQWEFELSGSDGAKYFLEEFEIWQDGAERMVFSQEVSL